jgi:hypothetical protein
MLRLIADRAERKLRAFVTSKGQSFTPAHHGSSRLITPAHAAFTPG